MNKIIVTFKSRSLTGREFKVAFDLGSEQENALKALQVAWQRNASIIHSEVA